MKPKSVETIRFIRCHFLHVFPQVLCHGWWPHSTLRPFFPRPFGLVLCGQVDAVHRLCLADPSDGTTAAAEMESVAGRVEFGGCTSILPHNYILNAKNNSRFVKKMRYQFQWRYIINFVATTLIYRVDWSMVGKWPQTWVNWCQLLSPGSRPRRFGWFFTKPCFDLAWHSATAWGSGLEEKRVLGVFFGCC